MRTVRTRCDSRMTGREQGGNGGITGVGPNGNTGTGGATLEAQRNHGITSESQRNQDGITAESRRNHGGIRTESERNQSGITRREHHIRSFLRLGGVHFHPSGVRHWACRILLGPVETARRSWSSAAHRKLCATQRGTQRTTLSVTGGTRRITIPIPMPVPIPIHLH